MTENYPRQQFIARIVRWLERDYVSPDPQRRKALARILRRRMKRFGEEKVMTGRTLGERLADDITAVAGSWAFVLGFLGFLAAWTVLNTEVLGPTAFDAYPYVFLNLLLSMVAAIQAPLILMSQNRQSARDRRMMEHDYEVNLRAELEILSLHLKLDELQKTLAQSAAHTGSAKLDAQSLAELHQALARIEQRMTG